MHQAAMSSSMGLYYPYIHFRDGRWLRLAALYWARMARIVPRFYPTEDSEDVRRLSGELGFVKDLTPSPEVTGQVAREFATLIEQDSEALLDLYGVHLRASWRLDPYSMRVGGVVGGERGVAWIHVAKVDYRLRMTLIESGLGLDNRDGDPMWVGVHPRVATVYMSALAQELGRHTGFSPVSDEPLSHLAVGGWPMSRLMQALLQQRLHHTALASEQLTDALVLLSIGYVVPKDLANIPIERVVKLRRQHATELDTLRSLASSLTNDLANAQVEDPAMLAEHLQVVYESKIAPAQRELKQSLRSAGMDVAMTSMNAQIAAPALLTSSAALAGVTVDPMIAVGGALAATALPVLRQRRTARAAKIQHSPIAYLMHVERDLAPKALIGRCRKHLQSFL